MQLRSQWILISFVIKVSREEYTNFSAFSPLGPLSQVFRQVKERLILYFAWNDQSATWIRGPNFYDQYWQEKVLKLMKNHRSFSIFNRFGLFR